MLLTTYCCRGLELATLHRFIYHVLPQSIFQPVGLGSGNQLYSTEEIDERRKKVTDDEIFIARYS